MKVQKAVRDLKGGNIMLAVNYTTLRDNMKSCMDRVTDDYETMIVTRTGGTDAGSYTSTASCSSVTGISSIGHYCLLAIIPGLSGGDTKLDRPNWNPYGEVSSIHQKMK